MQSKHVFSLMPLVACLWLGTAEPSAADVVSLTITGKIGVPIPGFTNGVITGFDGSIVVDTPYTAVFTIDANAPDLLSDGKSVFKYSDDSLADGATVSFGHYLIAPGTNSDDRNHQDYWYGIAGPDFPTLSYFEIYNRYRVGDGTMLADSNLILNDSTASAITKKGLPPIGPGMNDADRWNARRFYFAYFNPDPTIHTGGSFYASVDSITTTITAVPEPGSIALLFGMGLTGAGFLLKRRR